MSLLAPLMLEQIYRVLSTPPKPVVSIPVTSTSTGCNRYSPIFATIWGGSVSGDAGRAGGVSIFRRLFQEAMGTPTATCWPRDWRKRANYWLPRNCL